SRAGSVTSARRRSESSTPPGSRTSSAGRPLATRASRSAAARVDLPAPSMPSIVISLPRAIEGTLSLYDARMAAGAEQGGGGTLPDSDRHPHAAAVLGPALAPGGRPSHAYLFHGPPGSGKRSVARGFAAALLAEGAAGSGGAG